jgi:PAS domain S-box-containing protein
MYLGAVMQSNPSSSATKETSTDPIEKRSLLWSLIGLGMLLIITLIFGWTLRQVNDSDNWVEHTRNVISHNRQLLSDIKDAESAERGFIITGDENYLEPFYSAAKDIPPAASNLRQLVTDNPSQQYKVQALEDLIARRLEVLNNAFGKRRESGFTAAQAIVIAGGGRAAMEQIRDLGQEIENQEYQLLEQRSHTREKRVNAGFDLAVGATLLAIIGFILAPLDVRAAVRQRKQAQATQQESDSTAQALFEAAAQAIFIVDQGGRIVMANPATQKIFGYSLEELLGKSIDLLLPERLRQMHVQHRDQYFAQPQNRPMGMGMDLQAHRKDGSDFFAEISLSYIQTSKGTLAVAFVTDISKRRADSQAILEQKDELRRLAGQLMTAQDDERRRIARDLHDDLSQKLAYLAMDIGKLATKPSSQNFVPDLRPLQLRAAEAAESVRRISHQLHPAVLDDIGLEGAIEQYCEEFEERAGIATEFTAKNVPQSLPRDVSSSLYHIFQECLRNVSKHSQTDAVLVTLEHVDGVLRLTIRDRGVGLAPQRAEKSVSIGILGMKERANLINGTLSIQSELGQGTEVSVEVPLAPA